MCRLMDGKTHRKIVNLLVRAGGTMEDESFPLVTQLPTDPEKIGHRIARLAAVAADLTALATAAKALLDKSH